MEKTKIYLKRKQYKQMDICEKINWSDWKYFIKKNGFTAIATIILEILIFGRRVNSFNFCSDMGVIVSNPGTTYNWLEIGRPGLVLAKLIFKTLKYNPYLAGMIFILTLWVTCMIMDYLIDFLQFANKKTFLFILFNLLFMTAPTLNEQFYFSFQAFEIVFGMLLTVIAAVFILRWILYNRKWDCIIATLCMLFSFSIYQSFVSLYIAICISVFIIYFLKIEKEKESGFYFKVIVRLLISFIFVFLIYEIMSKLFFNKSTYLEEQTSWGNQSIIVCLKNIIIECGKLVLGHKYFYNLLYPIIGIILGIYYLLYMIQCLKKHNFLKKGHIYYILSGYMFLISPILLSVTTGSVMVPRSQLTLPYVVAFSVVYLLNILSENLDKGKNSLRILVIIISIYFVYDQTAVMQRFFYTEDVRQKADEMTALGIVDDISEISSLEESNSFPVIFVFLVITTIFPLSYGRFSATIFPRIFSFPKFLVSS